jgi:SAM-dependent methyltransferase
MQLRRLTPLRNGERNGTAVIRYYWSQFLESHQADIRGHGLEVGETTTIRKYGGSLLIQADAIDLSPHSPEVVVVADLSRADHVPADTYDCFVNQFTTSVIYDIDAAIFHAIRILKPGGVLLINFWCLDFYLYRGLDMGTGAPIYMYRWFTPIQVENLLRRLRLSDGDFELHVYGNLLTRVAFLMNLPAEELTRRELEFSDPGQPLLICARIVKPEAWKAKKPAYREPEWTPELTAMPSGGKQTGAYGDHYESMGR